MTGAILWTKNGAACPSEAVPRHAPSTFRDACLEACSSGSRIAALSGWPPKGPEQGPSAPDVLLVLADDARSRIGLLAMHLPEGVRRYPSLTPLLPQAQAFERELFEVHGIEPEGHPWCKPVRRHDDLERAAPPAGSSQPARPHAFFRVQGPGLHEVAVGPVHAGIIEPGHFRFQCAGEVVLSLEIQLGYQHRGVEELMVGATRPARRIALAESIAGDTAIGHGVAHATLLEALAGVEAPLPAQALRAVALELERLANHVGDLGALCNDVGYLPGASWFGRLRGEFLNLLMALSGNRFGRGLVVPGGVRFALTPEQRTDFAARLRRAERDLKATAEVTFDTPSVASRFEHAGTVTKETAEAIGLVGPAARASGSDRDVRRDHPLGLYRFAFVPVSLAPSGDVMGRALVRWLETQRSITFVQEQLAEHGEGARDALRLARPCTPKPRTLAVALVEGWRGEIVHLAATDDDGALAAYKVVDPSFHNWFGLAMALRDNPISDFPLCNKSFNLSYAGHDL